MRGPIFEVIKNKAGDWFVRERASNGKIKNVSEAYASKSNAKRAAIAKRDQTAGARVLCIDVLPPGRKLH